MEGALSLVELDGDALHQILCRLDAIGLARTAAVSVALRDAAFEESLWVALVQRSFWEIGRHLRERPTDAEELESTTRMRFEHRQLTARRLFARCFRPAVDHNEVGPRQLAPALVSDAAERSAGTADADGGLLAMLRRMTSQVGASIGGAADSGDLYSRTAAGSTDYSTAEHDRRCSQRRSFCAACDDTLVICDADPRGTIRQPRRCPCVAARGAKLPLSIFGLSRRRSNSTSLEAQDTFGDLISCLENVFELRVVTADRIERQSLDGIDVMMLCTTESQLGLQPDEQAEVKRFVNGGGSAILSAFANWSANGSFNGPLVDWLGIVVQPHARFGRQCCHSFDDSLNTRSEPRLATSKDRSRSTLLEGPWGKVTEFTNTGETPFLLQGTDGFALSSIHRGQAQITRSGALTPRSELTTLAYFPRCTAQADTMEVVVEGVLSNLTEETTPHVCAANASLTDIRTDQLLMTEGQHRQETKTRQGQVLVLSNFHCFASARTWHGGHWSSCSNNRALLLNFMADAVAWRREPMEQVASVV